MIKEGPAEIYFFLSMEFGLAHSNDFLDSSSCKPNPILVNQLSWPNSWILWNFGPRHPNSPNTIIDNNEVEQPCHGNLWYFHAGHSILISTMYVVIHFYIWRFIWYAKRVCPLIFSILYRAIRRLWPKRRVVYSCYDLKELWSLEVVIQERYSLDVMFLRLAIGKILAVLSFLRGSECSIWTVSVFFLNKVFHVKILASCFVIFLS